MAFSRRGRAYTFLRDYCVGRSVSDPLRILRRIFDLNPEKSFLKSDKNTFLKVLAAQNFAVNGQKYFIVLKFANSASARSTN